VNKGIYRQKDIGIHDDRIIDVLKKNKALSVREIHFFLKDLEPRTIAEKLEILSRYGIVSRHSVRKITFWEMKRDAVGSE